MPKSTKTTYTSLCLSTGDEAAVVGGSLALAQGLFLNDIFAQFVNNFGNPSRPLWMLPVDFIN